MSKVNILVASISLLLILNSCAKSKIKGLWQVDHVLAHTDEVSPKGRWVRFDKKNYQESGNGWQKHSYGTYKIKRKEITVVNDNGPVDQFGAFKIHVRKKSMEWERHEDSRRTKILFTRIEEIPMSDRDKLIGIWDLDRVLEDGKESLSKYDPNFNRYIYIEWNNLFTTRNTPTGAHTGFYNTHTHRNEIEVFYNDDKNNREVWKYKLDGDKLVLTSANRKEEVIMEYHRIKKFL